MLGLSRGALGGFAATSAEETSVNLKIWRTRSLAHAAGRACRRAQVRRLRMATYPPLCRIGASAPHAARQGSACASCEEFRHDVP